jgi:hypothetical protein
LVGNPEGKSLLGTPKSGWENNIKLLLKRNGGMVWTGVVWAKIGTGIGNTESGK